MQTIDEIKICRNLKACLDIELDQNCAFGLANETRKDRFARLAAILQNMNAGKSGGGLSGGLASEKLWVELLKDINAANKTKRFTFETKEADADYAYTGHAFSHKTIGYRNKNADLALAWSKNRRGGIVRTFESSMVLVSFRPANPRSKTKFWRTAKTGVYIIPLSKLKQTVRKFKPNNKTSTLIKAAYVVKLMSFAKEEGLFIPLEIDQDRWMKFELSYWKAGDSCVVRQYD
jgi:hypothetical protein